MKKHFFVKLVNCLFLALPLFLLFFVNFFSSCIKNLISNNNIANIELINITTNFLLGTFAGLTLFLTCVFYLVDTTKNEKSNLSEGEFFLFPKTLYYSWFSFVTIGYFVASFFNYILGSFTNSIICSLICIFSIIFLFILAIVIKIIKK